MFERSAKKLEKANNPAGYFIQALEYEDNKQAFEEKDKIYQEEQKIMNILSKREQQEKDYINNQESFLRSVLEEDPLKFIKHIYKFLNNEYIVTGNKPYPYSPFFNEKKQDN